MIAVIGDLMLDVFLLPTLRDEEQSHGVVARPGGSAANTAVWLAHLGCEVTLVACAGDDELGRMLVQELAKRGVQSHVRLVPGFETGLVVVEVSETGERTMRSARGANEALSPHDVGASCPGCSFVHLTGYALLGCAGIELLQSAARCARASQAILSFDPSSVGVVRRFGYADLLDALSEARVGLLLPNADEAAALTGLSKPEEAIALLRRRIQTVIVKDGANGAVCSSAGTTFRVASTRVRPVDTTGAGDAFDAGILAALQAGKDLPRACLEAHRVAKQVLGAYGGWPVDSEL